MASGSWLNEEIKEVFIVLFVSNVRLSGTSLVEIELVFAPKKQGIEVWFSCFVQDRKEYLWHSPSQKKRTRRLGRRLWKLHENYLSIVTGSIYRTT